MHRTLRAARPGRRASWVAVHSAYGGGVVGALGAAGYGVIRAQAGIARKTIGEPTEQPPDPSGRYGKHRGRPLRLVMIGDSSSAGLGCDSPAQTPGALIAGQVAKELRRPVDLQVVAVVGGRSADLDVQVGRALSQHLDVAVVMVGANDVTHRVVPGDAARDLGRVVKTLRAAGAVVVVGTCPDLGAVQPLLQPLRSVAQLWSRRLAAAQAVAVAENDGIAVSLGSLLNEEFRSTPQMWSADRFHPSADGYRRVADALLPPLLEGLGVPVSEPVVSDEVHDVEVAASVAAREPGLEVQTLDGDEGIASTGPGRLARLVRRLPFVGEDPDLREGPAGPSSDAPQDALSHTGDEHGRTTTTRR